MSAVEAILDRLEGKSKQQLDFHDISDDIRKRSTADLQFYLDHCHWPEEHQEEDLEAAGIEEGDDLLIADNRATPAPASKP